MKIGDLIAYRHDRRDPSPVMLVTKVEPDDSTIKVGNIVTVQIMGRDGRRLKRVHTDWVEVLSEGR